MDELGRFGAMVVCAQGTSRAVLVRGLSRVELGRVCRVCSGEVAKWECGVVVHKKSAAQRVLCNARDWYGLVANGTGFETPKGCAAMGGYRADMLRREVHTM